MIRSELEVLTKSDQPTVWDRMDEFCQTELMQSGEHTRKACILSLNQFMTYVNKAGMSSTSINGLGLHFQKMGLSHCTVRIRIRDIRRFLRWCWRMGYTKTVWHEYLPKLRSPVFDMPEIIRHEEYLKLRETCVDAEKDWVMVLAYHTGLRLGDCCQLLWSQIDRATQVIQRVPNKNMWKSRKPVYIPYLAGSDLQVLIDQRWLTHEDEPNAGKDYVSPAMAMMYVGSGVSVVHQFRRIFDKAGVRGRTFKHFRSTFESRLANSGVNLALASQLTGRSDMRTLLRYVKPDIDCARSAVGKAMLIHETVPGFK